MRKFPLGVLVASLFYSPAYADHFDAAATEYVNYGDLDLATNSGRATLEHRLHAAASRLCTDDNRAVPTAYVDVKCVSASLDRAHAQMTNAIARTAMTGSSSVIALGR